MKVVIVEDNVTSADLIARQLSTLGNLEIHFAETAADGMHLVEAQQPEFLIVDERLPDVSGIDLIREARRQNNEVMIIMCTVVDDDDTINAAFEVGCNFYTIKPNGLRRLCEQYPALDTLYSQSNQEIYQ